jgi:hypothetical protein
MPTSVPKLAGRLAVALLLVLFAAGTVLAAAATRPSPPAFPPAEESSSPAAEPTAGPTVEPAEPTAEPSAPPTAEPTAPPTAEPTAAPARAPETAAPKPADDPDEDDVDGTPSAANLARVVEKLAAHGITTTADQLAALAAKVGLGGAVRVLVFADASGQTPAEILATFDSGKGWGVIAKELGLHPGIGSIMGNGKGHDRAAKAAEKAARAAERAERKAAGGD